MPSIKSIINNGWTPLALFDPFWDNILTAEGDSEEEALAVIEALNTKLEPAPQQYWADEEPVLLMTSRQFGIYSQLINGHFDDDDGWEYGEENEEEADLSNVVIVNGNNIQPRFTIPPEYTDSWSGSHSPLTDIPGLFQCEHVWKHYQGFTDSFHYCTKCDEKKRGNE
jgi:hypothetical protein